MSGKANEAFRTISEVGAELDLPPHVLRFWETKFTQIKPLKRAGGRRYYRPDDVAMLRGVQRMLYTDGYSIKGAQKVFREHGARYVVALGEQGEGGPGPLADAPETEAAPDCDPLEEALEILLDLRERLDG